MREEVPIIEDAGTEFNVSTYSISDGDVYVLASGDNSKLVLLDCQLSRDNTLIRELVDDKYKIKGKGFIGIRACIHVMV